MEICKRGADSKSEPTLGSDLNRHPSDLTDTNIVADNRIVHWQNGFFTTSLTSSMLDNNMAA